MPSLTTNQTNKDNTLETLTHNLSEINSNDSYQYDSLSTRDYLDDENTIIKSPDSQKLVADKNATLSASCLPSEILINIFSWLDIRSIDAAVAVCKKWNQIISDDAVWRGVFLNSYDRNGSFSRLTSSLSWKTEVIERHMALRRWKKSAGSKNVSFKIPLPSLDSFAVDFFGMRIITFSITSELGFVVDLLKGRLGHPAIRTSKLNDENSSLSSIPALSKFGIVFPFTNNRITTLSFSRGTSVRDFKRFPNGHDSLITYTWTSSDISHKTQNSITCLTGDLFGTVKSWDFNSGNLLFEFTIPTPHTSQNHQTPDLDRGGENPQIDSPSFAEIASIVFIDSDAEKQVVCCDTIGRTFHYNKLTKKVSYIGFWKLCSTEISLPVKTRFAVDFACGYFLVNELDYITRFRFPLDTNGDVSGKTKTVSRFVTSQAESSLSNLVLDSSLHTGIATPTTAKGFPGGQSRLMAALNKNGTVFVWNVRHDVVDLSNNQSEIWEIEPIYCVENPFSGIAGVTTIAINSLVLAICSSFGMVMIHNVINGKKIRLATTRFPKKSLDYDAVIDHSYHVILDTDASKCHGVVIIDSSIQYFNYGVLPPPSKLKGIKKRNPGHRTAAGPSTPRNSDLLKEIEDEYEIAKEILEQQKREETHRSSVSRSSQDHNSENSFLSDMSEDQQLKYALMISQEDISLQSGRNSNSKNSRSDNEEDEDLKRAIKLSLETSGTELILDREKNQADFKNHGGSVENETSKLNNSQTGNEVSNTRVSVDGEEQTYSDEVDDDMDLAIRLSLQHS